MGTTARDQRLHPSTLDELSEQDVLRRIFPRLPSASAALLGPGDDAAVLAAPDGRYVVTTDMMIHGPDFRLAWSSPRDLGWKAAATNLADVAAMGAVPIGLVVAIAAPRQLDVSVLEGIADGLAEGCNALAPGCGVVGGDLSVSSVLTLAVTAFGDMEGRAPVLRSGAHVGDIVALSGALGQAAAGLRVLFSSVVDPATGQPDPTRLPDAKRTHGAIIDAQLRPRPPISDGRLAAMSGATAMMDVSDGLVLDARRLAHASQVAVNFDSRLLGPDLLGALTGGEDHSLLATFPRGTELPGGFRALGQVQAGSGVCVDGEPFTNRGGWDPYQEWDGHAD